jgi:hypothetical protein
MTRYLKHTAAAVAAVLLALGMMVPIAFAPPTTGLAAMTVPVLA